MRRGVLSTVFGSSTTSFGRTLVAAAAAILPRPIKLALYRRVLGYEIGQEVRIGFSLLDVRHCRIGDGTTIGHLNAIIGVDEVVIGRNVIVGLLNVVRGGERFELSDYAVIRRQNAFTSTLVRTDGEERVSRLTIGPAAILTSGHRIDFTAEVRIGARSIIGGRSSSIWTHSRWEDGPVTVGRQVFLGSESRIAPGASIPDRCVVGIGSVVVGTLPTDETVYAGVPARAVRPLDDRTRAHVDARTRADMPLDL